MLCNHIRILKLTTNNVSRGGPVCYKINIKRIIIFCNNKIPSGLKYKVKCLIILQIEKVYKKGTLRLYNTIYDKKQNYHKKIINFLNYFEITRSSFSFAVKKFCIFKNDVIE